jgi:hypothetical protein
MKDLRDLYGVWDVLAEEVQNILVDFLNNEYRAVGYAWKHSGIVRFMVGRLAIDENAPDLCDMAITGDEDSPTSIVLTFPGRDLQYIAADLHDQQVFDTIRRAVATMVVTLR